MKETNAPLERLKHHVTGAIERGEKVAIVGVTAEKKFTAFHWPDHNIGKRESRRIREEHNALFNSHAELLAALESVMVWNMTAATERDWNSYRLAVVEQARQAIAKAKGGV